MSSQKNSNETELAGVDSRELKSVNSTMLFLKQTKEELQQAKDEHRRERKNSRLSMTEGQVRRRSSSFNIVGATASKKRSDNKFNSAYVNDEHLIHDGVHIEKNSTCFGRSNAKGRTELFHILESSCMRMSVIGLLIVDVICVFFEIMFYDRVITPSFSQKTQAGTLYVPSNYVCADSSSVKSSALLTECCKEYQLHAGEFSQFKNVEACYLAHNNKTVLVDAHSSSSSGSAHRRMLLSAVVHGPALPHCYKPPPRFEPHREHYAIETIVHILSFAILVFFAIELLGSLYVFGIKQFFCSCYKKIEKGQTVDVKEIVTSEADGTVKEQLRRGKVDHINISTGDIDVEFYDNKELVKDIPRPIISLAAGEKPGRIVWHHATHVLDFIVVYVSLIFEIIALLPIGALSANVAIHFLILFRILRFVRVIHGVYESRNSLKHELDEFEEFKSDAKWFFSQIETQLKKVKFDKVQAEKGTEIAELRRCLRYINILVEEFNEENVEDSKHGEK